MNTESKIIWYEKMKVIIWAKGSFYKAFNSSATAITIFLST